MVVNESSINSITCEDAETRDQRGKRAGPLRLLNARRVEGAAGNGRVVQAGCLNC